MCESRWVIQSYQSKQEVIFKHVENGTCGINIPELQWLIFMLINNLKIDDGWRHHLCNPKTHSRDFNCPDRRWELTNGYYSKVTKCHRSFFGNQKVIPKGQTTTGYWGVDLKTTVDSSKKTSILFRKNVDPISLVKPDFEFCNIKSLSRTIPNGIHWSDWGVDVNTFTWKRT